MVGEGSLTQAAATKVKHPCPADNCNETRASKQTLSRHIVKAHEGVQQGVHQLKNFLLSPMTKPSSSPGPPLAMSPAPVTAASTSAPSTTSGPTTIPSRLVFSQGADIQVDQEEGAENADEEDDDSTGDGDAAEKEAEEEEEEEDNMFEETDGDEDKWLHEALDKLTQEAIEAEGEASRQELKGKINEVTQKLQTKALHNKHMINKLRQEKAQWRDSLVKQRQLEDENERLKSHCESCSNSAEVIAHKETSLDEKDAKIGELGKKLKKLESEHKKTKDEYKTDIDTVHDTLANIAKRNNDLKGEVEKQKQLIKTLEAAKVSESDNVTNAEVHRQEDGQRVVMSVTSSDHKCNACGKTFNAAGDLDRHVEDKHVQPECQMCNKEFTTRRQAKEHICFDPEVVPQKCDKSYCNKEFANSEALKGHMKKAHYGNQRTVCKKCAEVLSNNQMKSHMEMCGKDFSGSEGTQERSLEVCKHWRRGRCDWGSSCNFSHIQIMMMDIKQNK